MQLWPGAYHHPQDHGVQPGWRNGGRRMEGAEEGAKTLVLCILLKSITVPKHAGGELLHSGVQKTIILKTILPAAVLNHYVTPVVAPKPALAQSSKCLRFSPKNSPSWVSCPTKTTQKQPCLSPPSPHIQTARLHLPLAMSSSAEELCPLCFLCQNLSSEHAVHLQKQVKCRGRMLGRL